MPWLIDYLPDTGVLQVTTSGRMGLADIRQMTIEALSSAAPHEARRFLIDHRKMLPAMTTEDLYDLHKINIELGVDHNLRAAIVYSVHSDGKDDFFFYEVNTLARGTSNIRLFTDLLQAIDWLTD
jgi:hypothetical protein